jgi:hypothetical protein
MYETNRKIPDDVLQAQMIPENLVEPMESHSSWGHTCELQGCRDLEQNQRINTISISIVSKQLTWGNSNSRINSTKCAVTSNGHAERKYDGLPRCCWGSSVISLHTALLQPARGHRKMAES